MSLVLQLQEEALRTDADLTNLLQKAFVVATKLDLRKFKKWVRAELDGYNEADVPEYRLLRGQLVYRNPFHGIQPIVIPDDPDLERRVTNMPLGDSVSQIRQLIQVSGETFQGHFPPDVRNHLMRMMRGTVEPFLVIATHQLKGVLDRVQTELIDWSLRLEKDGILGEGMRFSEAEKQRAVSDEDRLTPNFVLNIIGSMKDSQLQQYSPFGKQDQ